VVLCAMSLCAVVLHDESIAAEQEAAAGCLMMTAIIAFNNFVDRHATRRAWALPRNTACWFDTDFQQQWFFDHQVREVFHMSRHTFAFLVNEIGARVQRQTTRFRDPVPAAKCIAVCVDRLATGQSFRSLARSYSIGVSTAWMVHGECTLLCFLFFSSTPLIMKSRVVFRGCCRRDHSVSWPSLHCST
jgi:hypothetical protein